MSKTQVQLTEKQQEFYDTFEDMVFEPGRTQWPSVREMVKAMGLSSTSEAHRYMLILTGYDYLEHESGDKQPYTLPGWRFETRLVRDEVSE